MNSSPSGIPNVETHHPLFGPSPQSCLAPSLTVRSDDEELLAFVHEHAGSGDHRSIATRLYYAVRDGIRYDPYGPGLTPHDLAPRATLASGRGWCVSKAVLLAAAYRAAGIPARLGFADVRNHLSTERMRARMKTDVFYWHGFTAVHLDGRWLKATPAFNVELCEKFGLLPLEFDGKEDSIYHPFDRLGRSHMEYLRLHGEYLDVPLDLLIASYSEHYPYMLEAAQDENVDFQAEVDVETDDR